MNLSAELKNFSIPEKLNKKAELIALLNEAEYRWDLIGRESQQLPDGDWDVWAIIAGRGFGKTRTGSEITRIWSDEVPSILLVGATSTDLRDIMIEGPSGILSTSPKYNYPNYEPSKMRLTWPNGCICHIRSAEDPDRIRGIQTYRGWFDEFASWKYPEMAWDMISMSVRKGDTKKLITTTPRNLKILKKILEYDKTTITKGFTYENIENLSEAFRQTIINNYEGTRIGRQEIYAEILEDVEGALWKQALIDKFRVSKAPEMKRIVVAVDPAVSANENSDETGIIVCGLGIDNHGYVLNDASGIFTPSKWAKRTIFQFDKWEADKVIAEKNNGGDLVESNVRTIRENISYKSVWASKGKKTRAEPVVSLYEQGKIHHVGSHPKLEEQMTTWDAENDKSPDRVDALVWGFTELMLQYETDTNVWI